MKRLIIFGIILLFTITTAAQQQLQKELSGYVNPDEIVTLSETIPFTQAIEVLSTVSEKLTGKTIVSTAGLNEPIGIEIDKMPYKKALTLIVQYKNLAYDEKENVIVVRSKTDTKESLTEDVYAPIDSREVRVSGVIFEANISDMRERGINWEYLLSKTGISFGTKLRTFSTETDQQSANVTAATQQEPPDFTIENETEFDLGSFSGTATSAFKFFESEQLGEIIAKPSISVRNKQQGRIQIGSDISIKERDFAGNLIDKFYSTGTIIEFTPYIYTEDGVDYILCKLKVERSSANPDVISTEIRKTQATTEILMLDGEETIIGGLFSTEETDVRRGIPFLKDLPWWVLGIRYLAGYDSKQLVKREIIILIKVEILPSLKERIAQEKEENLIKSAIRKGEEDMKKYSIENMKKDESEDN